MLLNEVQKQYHRSQEEAETLNAQQQKIDEQQKEISQLKERLSRIEKMLAPEAANDQPCAASAQGN